VWVEGPVGLGIGGKVCGGLPTRRYAGGQFCIADFGGGLVITNKVFFDLFKNTVFLQFFQNG
jgi:hypothetical protein